MDFFTSVDSSRIANERKGRKEERRKIVEFLFFFSNRDLRTKVITLGMERDIIRLRYCKIDPKDRSNFSSNFKGMNVDERCAVGNILRIRQIKRTAKSTVSFSSISVNFKRLSKAGR